MAKLVPFEIKDEDIPRLMKMMNEITKMHGKLHEESKEHRVVDPVVFVKSVQTKNEDERLILAFLMGRQMQRLRDLGLDW